MYSSFDTLIGFALQRVNRVLAQLLSAHVIGAESQEFASRAGQIGTVSTTARHPCDVFSKLCKSGAQLWTRFGVLRRV